MRFGASTLIPVLLALPTLLTDGLAQDLYRPVIIGHSTLSASVQHDPPPLWATQIQEWQYMAKHPKQMHPSGQDQQYVHSVSLYGDLTHGGTPRHVLDWRVAADQSKALIVTAETAASEANPTWYYDGVGDQDDVILFDDLTFDSLQAARWSVNGNRIAFEARRVADGATGIFVGDVTRDGAGHPDGLGNIQLVVEDGLSPSWGGSNRLACFRSDFDTAWVVDVTNPFTPPLMEVPASATAKDAWLYVPPTVALSHDGDRVAFTKTVAGERDIYIYQLSTETETRVTNRSRITPAGDPAMWIMNPEWSPDDTKIVFAATDSSQTAIRDGSLYTVDVNGSRRAKQITRPYVFNNGSNNIIVNWYIRGLWRDDVGGGSATPPAAPDGLGVVAQSSSRIDLSWSDNSGDEDNFEIQRSPDGAGWALIATTGANATSYSNTGLLANTTYHYRVRATNGAGASGYSNSANATTLPSGEPGDDVANGEIAVAGNVTGSFADTQASDDGYEEIRERESGGKPANRFSYLEHKWVINVSGGSSVVFHVEAYRTDSGEGDEFVFDYSTDDASYTYMLSVTKTIDDDTTQTCVLPNLSGTVYIRVLDADRTPGNRARDSVFIDHLFIHSQ